MNILVDKDSKTAAVLFGETPLRLGSDLVSLFAFLLLFILSFGQGILKKYD